MNEILKVNQIWIKIRDNKRYMITVIWDRALDRIFGEVTMNQFDNSIIYLREIDEEDNPVDNFESEFEYYEREFREKFILDRQREKFCPEPIKKLRVIE